MNETSPQPPPMTEVDIDVLLRMVAGMVCMGIARIEIHPSRWHIIVDALVNHQRLDSKALEADSSGQDLPLTVVSPTGDRLVCYLSQWQPQEPKTEACLALLANEYPVPPEEANPIWTPR